MPPRKRAKGAPPPAAPLVVDGWSFLMWPAFGERWSALVRAVVQQRKADPKQRPSSPEATLLAALVRVIRDRIARNPDDPAARLRDPLSRWRRIKFLGRLRLFYRFSSTHRVVILTWLNDENTLRKEGSPTDPYVVFGSMLSRGEIPTDWDALRARALTMHAPLPDEQR